MGYFPDATIALLKGSYNLGIFFRLGTTPALHLAFSINDIPVYIPGLDSPSMVYTGAGQFLNIPDLETMINGIASKVSFALSGLNPVAVAAMLDTAPEVLGALVTVGICPMDQYWQPVGTIVPVWTGTAEFIAEEFKVENDPAKPQVQSLMLTASTGDMSRASSNLQTFSDSAQKTLYPTDNFCIRVFRYVQTLLIKWPRY